MKFKFKANPRRFKYKLQFRNLVKKASLNNWNKRRELAGGAFFVKVLEPGFLRYYQLRALKFGLLRYQKLYRMRIWLWGSFNRPLTTKPAMRMGTGKGKVRYWVAAYSRGDIILWVSGRFSRTLREKLFRIINVQISLRTRIYQQIWQ